MTTAPDARPVTRQSLAHGLLGAVLLHIERAHRGTGRWQAVHDQLATVGPLIDGQQASLFLGAPAMSYVLHLAAADSNRYAGALGTLDGIVTGLARRRLAAAHGRIDQGQHATFAEYDLFQGLTGLGALLLHRQPDSDAMKEVLAYLVRLTDPVTGPGGHPRPGWWVSHAPAHHTAATPDGHANAGLAHGISGPLAVLALAKRRGITVGGHDAAMNRICRWLDQIRHTDHQEVRWPRWITPAGPAQPAPPSWCYGTPGLARAQQLAALALGDEERKTMAERALLSCLADTYQLDQLASRGLCHGFGGLLRTVQRVAQDADDPAAFTDQLAPLSTRFLAEPPSPNNGFLEGTAGAALAFHSAEPGSGPTRHWDACLLLN